ncbi:translation initiation factor eIF-2B subunit delta [Plasticicumulans lactativorans]|uniref:Translation initiation factor eIF-2B subunit delta n=1 Tax=Plasticicumulans lactativorans TaxID=1133106 RepID=A0A4R2KY36_9GAMM|nr:hypothetical protein [Plasticicumulans lactativorans]TCO79551.1 translation initiation factor eIF-2B subunit delta [Plasticicumulans lactativorans]
MTPAFTAGLAALAADRRHGATELARSSLELLAALATTLPAQDVDALRAALCAAAAQVRACRPSMAPLGNLTDAWQAELAGLPPTLAVARRAAADAATRLITATHAATAALAGHIATLLGRDRTVLTHSFSSTVLAGLARLAGHGLQVRVTEARPLNEGWTLATRLAALGIPVSVYTDAQAALALAGADAVLLGADTRLADGGCVNKAGSLPIALAARAARAAGVPVYVACEQVKRSPARAATVALERMEVAELGYPEVPGVTLCNTYFEVVPGALVSAWVSEDGVTAAG